MSVLIAARDALDRYLAVFDQGSEQDLTERAIVDAFAALKEHGVSFDVHSWTVIVDFLAGHATGIEHRPVRKLFAPTIDLDATDARIAAEHLDTWAAQAPPAVAHALRDIARVLAAAAQRGVGIGGG